MSIQLLRRLFVANLTAEASLPFVQDEMPLEVLVFRESFEADVTQFVLFENTRPIAHWNELCPDVLKVRAPVFCF